MAKIVIIGAGLTGLSAAYHLQKAGFSDYEIYEGESTIGGLCRSVIQDGFTFDYTGHLLHINDPYFKTLIEDVVGMESFNSVMRRSFIYSHNVYTHYPFQVNLFGLPSEVIAECIETFVHRKKLKNINSFYDWVLHNFGKGIAKNFFFPYQQKIFAYDIKKITSTWTGRFVPSTSLKQIIQGALKNPEQESSIGYNAQFFYPKKGGIFFWIDKLAQAIKKPIKTNHYVQKINLKNKTLQFSNGSIEKFEHLITTVPLDRFLGLVEDSSGTHFKQQQDKLICNSVLNFNIGVNRPDLSDKHWIYFPERQAPFYRIGFPHNFTPYAVPSDCSSLYGEFSYIKKSDRAIATTLKKSLAFTKKLLNISPQDIMTEKIINISHAYVIYDFWRERNLPKLLHSLTQYDIHSVGRYGAWKYSSMQEGVMDGKAIAEKLLIKYQ